jgi:hypothetical protein
MPATVTHPYVGHGPTALTRPTLSLRCPMAVLAAPARRATLGGISRNGTKDRRTASSPAASRQGPRRSRHCPSAPGFRKPCATRLSISALSISTGHTPAADSASAHAPRPKANKIVAAARATPAAAPTRPPVSPRNEWWRRRPRPQFRPNAVPNEAPAGPIYGALLDPHRRLENALRSRFSLPMPRGHGSPANKLKSLANLIGNCDVLQNSAVTAVGA